MGMESFNATPNSQEDVSKLLVAATCSIENEYKNILGHDLSGYEATRAKWIAEFPGSLEEFKRRLVEGGIETEIANRMAGLEEVQNYYEKLNESV